MFKNTAAEILEHVEEQHQLEKVDALDMIELENKSKKFEIIKVYTSHYILGLKVIILYTSTPVYFSHSPPQGHNS